ncbi:hypothetical protein HRbin15_02456 [bacterium HR15]|nr:hypothetical protein HRbin15_02456 [bacterium HR15]
MRRWCRNGLCLLAIGLLLVGAVVKAQQVYLLGTGYAPRDAALYDALTASGFQVTLGVPYRDFNGSQNLSQYQVVVLVGAGNYDDMPPAGQDRLREWVRNGGGLVTLEWSIWATGEVNRFLILRALFPAVYDGSTRYRPSIQYRRLVSDPVLDRGLAPIFTLGEGHESSLRAKPGAVRYYASDYPNSETGVIGWTYQNGRVISLSVAPGYALDPMPQSLTFRQLFANAVQWAANLTCTPSVGDVNRNGCVDDADLLEVLFAFGTTGISDADVNCDGVVDDADLLEVLFHFGNGC